MKFDFEKTDSMDIITTTNYYDNTKSPIVMVVTTK